MRKIHQHSGARDEPGNLHFHHKRRPPEEPLTRMAKVLRRRVDVRHVADVHCVAGGVHLPLPSRSQRVHRHLRGADGHGRRRRARFAL